MFKFSPPARQYLDLKTGSSVIQNPKRGGIWKQIFKSRHLIQEKQYFSQEVRKLASH